VAFEEFEDENETGKQRAIQAEFSVLNTDYLCVLLRQEDDQLVSHHFKVYNLTKPGPAELGIALDE